MWFFSPLAHVNLIFNFLKKVHLLFVSLFQRMETRHPDIAHMHRIQTGVYMDTVRNNDQQKTIPLYRNVSFPKMYTVVFVFYFSYLYPCLLTMLYRFSPLI